MRKTVVLDDDPTGTQTVHDLAVLTTWDAEALRGEFLERVSNVFYVLTNTRALPEAAAVARTREIARGLQTASVETGIPYRLVSRSDSTLRGHFPAELEALEAELGEFDAWFVAPFFAAGGRVTLGDTHFLRQGETLTPVAETEFARDPAFGFGSSNLRDWVLEKSGGRLSATSLPLETLRGDPEALLQTLLELPRHAVCIVNSERDEDMGAFCTAARAAETLGRRFLYRSAASLVAALGELEGRELLLPRELELRAGAGGLTVVGSYVQKSSVQLERLLTLSGVHHLELSVVALLETGIGGAALEVSALLEAGRDVVVSTSRTRIGHDAAVESLETGSRISKALCELVRDLTVRPRYLIAKGGITSSDLATHGLGIRRAWVLGQIAPGVSVWTGDTASRFSEMPYVVFPGNVGDESTLRDLVQQLRD